MPRLSSIMKIALRTSETTERQNNLSELSARIYYRQTAKKGLKYNDPSLFWSMLKALIAPVESPS